MKTSESKKLQRLTKQLNATLKNNHQQEDGGYYEIKIHELGDKLKITTQYWTPNER